MSTVADVLKAKASNSVVMIEPGATVLQAARLMNEHRIGSLVVGSMDRPEGDDASAGVAGIITERDIMTRVVAAELDPAATPVERVMTTPVISCGSNTTLDELRAIIRRKHIRHVPVVDKNAVVGMVSIGDLNQAEASIMIETIQYLERYMYQP